MATARLAAQQAALLKRTGTLVTYQPFVEVAGNTNTLTKEVIAVETAYPTSISLHALIEYSPSEATRKRLGLEEDAVAILTLLVEECTQMSAVVNSAGRFFIAGDAAPFYVTKTAPAQQSANVFLTLEVGVTRKVGGQRNR
ncbi:hypothetical protein M0R72_07885 [Candidatus Pacearchaeota archaeon]|jgi:hypothetical protein|nr:hypothetical protein [Candidatus Pacearchaeota archaeon]